MMVGFFAENLLFLLKLLNYGKGILIFVMLVIIVVQAGIIVRLKKRYRRFQKEVDMERRINYSHFD